MMYSKLHALLVMVALSGAWGFLQPLPMNQPTLGSQKKYLKGRTSACSDRLLKVGELSLAFYQYEFTSNGKDFKERFFSLLDSGKEAMLSFVVATILSIGIATVAIPTSPVVAAVPPANIQKSATVTAAPMSSTSTISDVAAKAIVKEATTAGKTTISQHPETITPMRKLPWAERQKVMAQQKLEKAQQALAEAENTRATLQNVNTQIDSMIEKQGPRVTIAQKQVALDSDRLNAYEQLKTLPPDAMKDMNQHMAQARGIQRMEEHQLQQLTNGKKSATRDLQKAERQVEQSKISVRSAKKQLESAERKYQRYQTKMQRKEQKELARKRATERTLAKSIRHEEKRIRQWENQQHKLQSRIDRAARRIAKMKSSQ